VRANGTAHRMAGDLELLRFRLFRHRTSLISRRLARGAAGRTPKRLARGATGAQSPAPASGKCANE
jgi:hypothetical protein